MLSQFCIPGKTTQIINTILLKLKIYRTIKHIASVHRWVTGVLKQLILGKYIRIIKLISNDLIIVYNTVLYIRHLVG